jgi:hypothetical protein
MIQDTPRTDDAEYLSYDSEPPQSLEMVDVAFARQLERELNAANERIKQLDETLEAVTDKIDTAWAIYMEFKEAKP